MSDVIVIGGGAVGTATALELARRGAEVTLLERGPSVASGASAGNAGIVGPSLVVPLAAPDTLREGVLSLARRHAPFALRPRPSLVPWLARFALAALPARHAAASSVLARLAARSAELHAALGARFDIGYAREGFLAVYEHEHKLTAAHDSAARAPGHGELLDGAALRDRHPAVAEGPPGAILFPDEAHVDPAPLVHALAGELEREGGRVRPGVEVLGLRSNRRRICSLSTTAGELDCGAVVVATGAWSPRLGRALGLRIPVQGGKGYAIEYDGVPVGLRTPLYFPERRIVLTPLRDRLRLTGMLELCGTDLSVDEVRVQTIRRQAARLVPGLGRLRVTRVWRGLRPCTPDGLPIVGRAPRFDNAWLATGHGMWGLQLAPVTAELLAPAVGDEPGHALPPELAPGRFRLHVGRSADGGHAAAGASHARSPV